MLLVADFESYYDKVYSLKKLTTEAYIRDPRFYVHGVGLKVNDRPTVYVQDKNVEAFLAKIPWAQTYLLAHNCIPGDVEVLTPQGWKAIKEAACSDQIMQWNSITGGLSFVYPQHKTEALAKSLYKWESNFHSCSYTPGHRMYYTTPNRRRQGIWSVAPAEAVSEMGPNNVYIPTAGDFYADSPLLLADAECRFMEATRADGSWVMHGDRCCGVRFKFKKQRKIERCKAMLTGLAVPFRAKTDKHGATSVVVPTCTLATRVFSLLGRAKKYGSWVLGLPLTGRQAILDEARYWDGNYKTPHSYAFSSTDKDTVDAFQLMAHCSGWMLSSGQWKDNNRGYGEGKKNKLLWVGMVRKKAMAKLIYRPSVVPHNGPVYCFAVPSGAFMVRSNGRVHITGNCRFDAAILSWRYGIRPAFLLDTMSMARAVFPHESSSLANLSKLCGLGEKGNDLINFLGVERLNAEQQVQMGAYCCNDVDLTYALFQKLKVGFPSKELQVIDNTLRMFTEPILELDAPILHMHRAMLTTKRMQLLNGRDLTSLRSNPQFAALLVELGVEPPMKMSARTKKQTFAFSKTDEGMLALLEHENIEVQEIVAARLGVKSSIELSRTNAFLEIESRGNLPVPLNYFGAQNTGRFSGSDGINVQNLTRGGALRKSIIAPEGYVLAVADLNAIEARVTSWFAGEEGLLNIFREPGMFEEKRETGFLKMEWKAGDPYCAYASRVYGRTITKADKMPRQLGKTAVLGLNFGMGWRKFASVLASGPLGMTPIILTEADFCAMGGKLIDLDTKGITTKLKGDALLYHCSAAKHLVDMYRGTYKQVPKYWKTCNQMLQAMHRGVKHQFGVLSTDKDRILLPNGLSLQYKDIHTDEKDDWVYLGKRRETIYLTGPKLCENVTQAVARIIMTDAQVEIAKRYKVVMTVHDEVVCCVPEDEGEEALKYMLYVMSQTPKWAPGLPVAAEGGISYSYGEAK